jgi:tetratricopeptide (TPR) repeat protein
MLNEQPENADIAQIQAQLDFLMLVFTAVSQSDANPDVIYPIFRANLQHINISLIFLLEAWMVSIFAEVDVKKKKFIARTIYDFANLIDEFSLGSRAMNLEIGIASFEIISTVLTSSDEQLDWGAIQNSLGIAYLNRIHGDRAENLEYSISYYEIALKVYIRKDFPEDWANIQNNLAVAYSERIRGNRAENLELSISYYQAALEVRTQADFPEDWAMTQSNLATTYSERIQGNRAEI